MKHTLLFDTSTEKGVLGICYDAILLYEKHLPEGLQSSKFLIPEISDCLAKLQMTPEDLAAIGVGIGPGSYTGIRVAAMTAKTLSYALKIPLIGFCTLEAFVPNEDGVFCSVIDAKIGGIYCQKGIKKGDTVIFETPPQLLSLEKLDEILHDVKYFVTPRISPLKERLSHLQPTQSIKWIETWPSLSQMRKVVMKKWEAGEFSTDGKLDLLYLRATQAEIEREESASPDFS